MIPKFNVMILGDAAVGKTSLIRNISGKPHEGKHLKTVAVDYINTDYEHDDGTKASVKIWDTAGQERFRNITRNFYMQADGMIIAFDVTNLQSFQNVRTWIQSIFKVKEQSLPLVLVCNKIDMEDKKVVQKSDIDKIS